MLSSKLFRSLKINITYTEFIHCICCTTLYMKECILNKTKELREKFNCTLVSGRNVNKCSAAQAEGLSWFILLPEIEVHCF